jgi:outer membrane protein assembly factor BamB
MTTPALFPKDASPAPFAPSTAWPQTATGSRPLPAFLLALAGLLLAAPGAIANEALNHWPTWRGPLANGLAPNANPPLEWSETRHLKWKVPIPGRGSATPIIWQDRIFIQTAIPAGQAPSPQAAATTPAPANQTGAAATPGGPRSPGGRGGGFRSQQPTEPHQFVLLCLDRETGQTLWQKTLREEVPHEGHHQADGTFASGSPVTDGRLVYAFFGSRGLHALDLDGNLKWSRDLGRQQTRNSFGEGSSPALIGQTLVVNWDHEGDDFVAALNATTGEELWRQSRQEITSWATPLVLETGDRTQVIISATERIRSYDLATGKLLWECGGMTQNVIPTPVAGHGLVYAISGFRGAALLALRPDRAGDLTGTDAIVWQHSKNTPYVPSPLLYDDKLYFLSGNNAMLSCFDALTGNPLIDAERIDGVAGVYASPVGAAGRVYLAGRNGAVAVLRHGHPLEILATNRLDDRFDASPALVGNALFLRGRETLYCLAEK